MVFDANLPRVAMLHSRHASPGRRHGDPAATARSETPGSSERGRPRGFGSSAPRLRQTRGKAGRRMASPNPRGSRTRSTSPSPSPAGRGGYTSSYLTPGSRAPTSARRSRSTSPARPGVGARLSGGGSGQRTGGQRGGSRLLGAKVLARRRADGQYHEGIVTEVRQGGSMLCISFADTQMKEPEMRHKSQVVLLARSSPNNKHPCDDGPPSLVS